MPLNPLEEALASKEDDLLETYMTETLAEDIRVHVEEIKQKAVKEARTAELSYQVERMTHDLRHVTPPQPRGLKPKFSPDEVSLPAQPVVRPGQPTG
jgi:hypothetical protein